MLEFNLTQRITLNFILIFLKIVNFINFEIKWLLFAVFTVFLSLSFWNLKDSSIEDFMKMTRRKPVLSLSETVPDSLLRLNTSANEQLVLSENNIKEVNLIETTPAKKVLSIKPLNLLARSYLVYDLKNQVELTSKNKNETLPPASLVKVLSVMYLTQDLNFNDRFKITSECTLVNGQKVGFRVGEEVSVKDLVYSSLIFSGADSICLLSRTNSNISIQNFNNYAKSIGLKNSNFTNYIGLDFTNNYTTSEDMLIMTKEFLKKEVFSEIVKLKSFQLENQRVITNTNKMLFSEKNSTGVKTGTTDGANENLIYRYTDGGREIDVLVVILNSANRYSDTKQIINNLNFD
jgi:D-alanyl-D-alanine carboxypeptidase